MRALTVDAKQLKLLDNLPEPTTRQGQVKLKVHCASLNPTDLDIANGDYDLFLRLYRVKSPVRTGLEFSGTVLEDSGRFRRGDRVFGYTHLMRGPKTHQDILCIDEDFVATMPHGLTFAQAAAAPIGAQTSWVAWHRLAILERSNRVLVIGGSGGVGVYAIQIAKRLNAHVTAIAGPDGQALMHELGADTVFNYREQDIESLNERFDAILDLTCQYRFKNIRHLLQPNGVFIPADPLKNIADFPASIMGKQKVGYLYVDRGDHQVLAELVSLFDNGELVAPDSLVFELADYAAAIDALNRPGTPGRIVLDFGAS